MRRVLVPALTALAALTALVTTALPVHADPAPEPGTPQYMERDL